MLSKFSILFLFVLGISCQKNSRYEATQIIKEWQNKVINFTEEAQSYLISDSSSYKILVYVDSSGCSSCKLQLNKWKEFIDEIKPKPNFLFCIHSKDEKEINFIRRRYQFFFPIYQDINDTLNKLNHFPKDERFHTFLLDSNNRVRVIGNPVHNPKIKELYLKVIRGDTLPKKEIPETTVSYEAMPYSLGEIKVKESRDTTFLIENTGKQPLIVMDITTSCGCVIPRFDKKPVKPGGTFKFSVEMRPDNVGHFEKTVSVYCNVSDSPILFKLKGTAIESKK